MINRARKKTHNTQTHRKEKERERVKELKRAQTLKEDETDRV